VTREISRSSQNLHSVFRQWAAENEILDVIQANTKMVATWVDLCAPIGTSLENQLLACRDLCIVFFALDDYEGADHVELFAQCRRVLDGHPVEKDHPLLQAYASTIEAIEARGLDMSYYKQRRSDLIEHYTWRNQARDPQNKQAPTFDEYLRRRRITIYTRQWIDLWEILEACCLSGEERESDVLRTALDEVVDWQIYENELVSVSRDIARGELNLVCILRDEQGLSLTEAAKRVSSLHSDIGARFEHLLARLHSASPKSKGFHRYVEILDRCYHGAIEINEVALGRYSRSLDQQ
jgi:hypothetical protein